MTVTVVVA